MGIQVMDDTRISVPRVMPRALVGGVASPGDGYLYVNAPKCGCSTIKRTLLQVEMDKGRLAPLASAEVSAELLHLRNPMDIRRLEDPRFLADAYIFTMVRNPYSRVLSAYLDKIQAFDENVTPRFEARYQVRAADLGFRAFLEILGTEQPVDMDPHWAPLSSLLGLGLIAYDHVGKLEDMESFAATVISRFSNGLTGVVTSAPHKRNTLAWLKQYYDPGCKELVNEIYRLDFENFGYRPGELDGLAGESVGMDRVNRPAGSLFLGADDHRPGRLFFEAWMRLDRNDSQGALRALEQAIALDPDSAYAHYQLAHVLWRDESPDVRDQALDEVDRAIALKHDDPNFHNLRAAILGQGRESS